MVAGLTALRRNFPAFVLLEFVCKLMECPAYKDLIDLNRMFAALRDKRDLLQLVVKRLEPLFDFYDCGILLLDKEKRFYYDLLVRDLEIDKSAGNYFLRDSAFLSNGGK